MKNSLSNYKKIKVNAVLNNGKVLRVNSSKKRRIFDFIQMVKKLEPTEFNLRVVYGRIIDNFGKSVIAANSGKYKTIRELKHALACFTEK